MRFYAYVALARVYNALARVEPYLIETLMFLAAAFIAAAVLAGCAGVQKPSLLNLGCAGARVACRVVDSVCPDADVDAAGH